MACFDHCLKEEGNTIARAHAEQRMLQKLTERALEALRAKKYPGLLSG